MAKIKGWHKVGQDDWFQDVGTETTLQGGTYAKNVSIRYTAFGYIVTGTGNNFKTFPSRTKAVKYAIAWMKKHPRG